MRSQIALMALLCAGCEDPPRPWSGPPNGEVKDESTPFLQGRERPVWLGDAGLGDAGSDDDVDLPDIPAPSHKLGGLWVSCYDAFAPSGEPTRDVTRLGLMCGPVNGMDKVGPTREGQLSAGESRGHEFLVRKGDCMRIFAVAEPSMSDLDVAVLSSRSSRLTADASDDNWLIVDRLRPFCSFDDDTFRAEVRADGGSGRYALEVWRLPRTRSME